MQILIVDDDHLVRDFAVHTIEYGTNREVTTLENGFCAWEYIQNKPEDVDIIMADANIPEMDGLKLLGQVKKSYPRKIFIITSGNAAIEEKAYHLGADAFLSKPYDVNDLFTIVQKFVIDSSPNAKSKVAQFPNNESFKAASES